MHFSILVGWDVGTVVGVAVGVRVLGADVGDTMGMADREYVKDEEMKVRPVMVESAWMKLFPAYEENVTKLFMKSLPPRAVEMWSFMVFKATSALLAVRPMASTEVELVTVTSIEPNVEVNDSDSTLKVKYGNAVDCASAEAITLGDGNEFDCSAKILDDTKLL